MAILRTHHPPSPNIFDTRYADYLAIFLNVGKTLVFSVKKRSRSDESHWLTDWLSDWLSVSIDFTDVTLVSDDIYRKLYWCDPDDPDDHDLVMKVI